MKITVLAVGKLKERYLKEACDEYRKRLSRFCELEVIEVEDEQAPESLSTAQELQLMAREADKLLKKYKEGSYLIVLDVKGQRLTSEAFSSRLDSVFLSGKSHVTFMIGGSLGLDRGLAEKADLRLSLSDMTFPHQLARMLLLEQLFRAFKIMRGETYHK